MFYLYTFTIYSVLCYHLHVKLTGQGPIWFALRPFQAVLDADRTKLDFFVQRAEPSPCISGCAQAPRALQTGECSGSFYVFFTIEFVQLHANMITCFTSIACHCVSVVFKYICVFVTPSIFCFFHMPSFVQ